MTCLLAQPQQKLQLNYKTTITQNHQKIVRQLVAARKFDNQGIKEVTFIQMGRRVEMLRHRDAEQAGPTPTCGG